MMGFFFFFFNRITSDSYCVYVPEIILGYWISKGPINPTKAVKSADTSLY